VYFANHTSHLDAVVLWAALPRELRKKTRPVAAKDYWSKGWLKPFLAKHAFNAVLIERTKVTVENNPMALLLQALDAGDSLIIFPEGTRSASGEIQSFKSGLYHIARERADVELVAVHLDNMNRILPKGEVLPVPLMSCITFGAVMRLESGESKTGFLERARAAVVSLTNP
jgi:1-acyl-sn-glycerol-3-phosphate acyltransferase